MKRFLRFIRVLIYGETSVQIGERLMRRMAEIEQDLEARCKHRADRWALLDNLNLSIHRGEITKAQAFDIVPTNFPLAPNGNTISASASSTTSASSVG